MSLALLAAVLGAAVLLLLSRLVWISLKYAGPMLVTCPENTQPAGVGLNLRRIARGGGLRLDQCSRWPEKRGCGQECLRQVEAAPQDCLVRTILANWCREQKCAICGRPIGEVHFTDHKPALLDPEKCTVAWTDVPAETVPAVMRTHAPVCWNCHIMQTFLREYPELAVDRARPAR
jgi:hypothetical protein